MGKSAKGVDALIILGIETASLVSSVALIDSDRLLAELTIETRKTHSEQLVPHLEKLLQLAEIDKEKLTGIAVSNGPGSFTGLRIGLATAKAMSYSLKIPIIGVSTLLGMAYNIQAEEALLRPLMDAQKGNFYTGLYEIKKGKICVLEEENIRSAEEILDLAQANSRMMLLGEGVKMLRDEILERNLLAQVAPPHLRMPRAASIAYGALERFQNEDYDNVMDLVPNYIRRSEAEELWEKKQQA